MGKYSRKAHLKSKGGKKLFSSDVPIDTQYHSDLSKKSIKKHVADIETHISRLDKEIVQAQIDKRQEQDGLNKYQTEYEKTRLANSAKYSEINTKWYIFILNGFFSILKYILSGIGAFLYIFVFVILANFLSLVFSMVKLIFTNYVFVGFILFCISIILILQFVFGYVVPLPGFVSKKPQADNLTKAETIAERKIDYQSDVVQKAIEFFTNLPNIFTNTMVNIRRLYQKLAKFFGNDDVLDLYMMDRKEVATGRWDNVYNMELGLMTQNFENIPSGDTSIYSIIKPAPLEMSMSDVHSLDVDKLPPSIQAPIKKDKDLVKFTWNVAENSQYKMTCNTLDKNNNSLHLFEESIYNECRPVKIPYTNEIIQDDNNPKYYDIPTRRGDKSLVLDLFVE